MTGVGKFPMCLPSFCFLLAKNESALLFPFFCPSSGEKKALPYSPLARFVKFHHFLKTKNRRIRFFQWEKNCLPR